MMAVGLQRSHPLPDGLTGLLSNTDPLNYPIQGSVFQTFTTIRFVLETTTAIENSKNALLNLLLHNKL